ncbi:hypothetical protein ACQUFY_28120 (plasmid) [Robbsia andropogonis]|uniref:hypothetical protein n=1 Tax=Robbsia andropogonis TaxID=28092 RepID=UPI003D1A79B7
MATFKQAKKRRLNMAERAQQQMDILFPNMPAAWVWRRKDNDGYTTLPRTLPLVMQAIDDRTKGTPAGHVLFCLWARSPDHPLVTIENPVTFAAEAGFQGERAVDTWRKRMKCLRDLGLIMTKPGDSGEFHYVLLLNPNGAMEWMRTQGWIQDQLYSRFISRIADIGAHNDIETLRAYWQQQSAAQAAQAALAAAAAAKPVPPPPTDDASDKANTTLPEEVTAAVASKAIAKAKKKKASPA